MSLICFFKIRRTWRWKRESVQNYEAVEDGKRQFDDCHRLFSFEFEAFTPIVFEGREPLLSVIEGRKCVFCPSFFLCLFRFLRLSDSFSILAFFPSVSQYFIPRAFQSLAPLIGLVWASSAWTVSRSMSIRGRASVSPSVRLSMSLRVRLHPVKSGDA